MSELKLSKADRFLMSHAVLRVTFGALAGYGFATAVLSIVEALF